MIRSIALALCLALPFAALAQDDASLLAPLAPHPTKPRKHRHKHNDLDQLVPLNLPTTLSVTVPGVSGAEVKVDGRSWGTAPVDHHKVGPGAHRVTVTRPGFATFSRRVVVHTGDRARVSARLDAVAGVLTVRTTPPGARVSLDGDPMGVTPLEQRVVKPGNYELRLRAPGFMDDLSRLDLHAGRDTVIDRALQPVTKPPERPAQVALAPTSVPEPSPLATETYASVDEPTPWYKHWYVWAGAGAVIAAAAVGVAASSGGTTVGAPPSASTVCGGACAGVLTP